MTYPVQKINSKWTSITGWWSPQQNNWVDQKEAPLPDKILTMSIREGQHGLILDFEGGPTGSESYYVSDLTDPIEGLHTKPYPFLCICGGTINSWPRCEVSSAEVVHYLNKVLS